MEEKKWKYFNFDEMIRSEVAEKYGISNLPPTEEVKENIEHTLGKLDLIREEWGRPIVINSGYRSEELNRKVGGVRNSQHIRGEAADLRWQDGLLEFIIQRGGFDQLIKERKGNLRWIHVSFKKNEEENRGTVITITK